MSHVIDWGFVLWSILALIGIKSVIFGQYWPWQSKKRCPHCKREW